MSESYTYLDYAASAPLRSEARAAYEEFLDRSYAGANPNSLHSPGRLAASALEAARSGLAHLIDESLRPSELVFTSGGTESNNLAILGLARGMRQADSSRNTVVLSAIEHESVLECASELRALSFNVRLVKPNRAGVVSAEALSEQLSHEVAVVSVMSANNETGIIQPISDLAEATHEVGALFHSDAVQSFCHSSLDLSAVDAASFAAHKFGGPRGIGALMLRARKPFITRSHGGGQEGARRSGTQDVASAVAMYAAARAYMDNFDEHYRHTRENSDKLYEALCSPYLGFKATSPLDSAVERLPGTVSVVAPGLESESLIVRLDECGFGVSAGSACASGSLEPSHVLSAMGLTKDEAFGALRISFDERVSASELDVFVEALTKVVQSLR
ncbi:MAG: cysteine desulfurase [Atopobiaceae bacterium]|nr:cysteine desulfurase [Atopobiaceae bacterium]